MKNIIVWALIRVDMGHTWHFHVGRDVHASLEATGTEGFEFILTTGTAISVQSGYVPSLAAGMATANPHKFLLQPRHCKA